MQSWAGGPNDAAFSTATCWMPAAPRVAETRMLGAAGSGSDVKLAGMPGANSGKSCRQPCGSVESILK